MEDFSTNQNRALPWAANTLTVAALALATWLSAAQRPAAEPGPSLVVHSSGAIASKTQPDRHSAGVQVASSTGAAQAASLVRPTGLPLQSVARDVVQPVSFLPLSKN